MQAILQAKILKKPDFNTLKALQNQLMNHKIYSAVKGQRNMRIFMQSHIFAVWDFMLLLKELQRKLTCTNKIWIPPVSNSTARFINEIVVGEETDLHPNGKSTSSHFQLYLEAMKQVGADTSPINNFITNIKKGKNVHAQLMNPKIPKYVQTFVNNTIDSIDRPTPYVAAQFFYGREDPIPQMFSNFVQTLSSDANCQFLKYYLKRHIQVDGQDHGPLAQKLMKQLSQRQDPKQQLILQGAINAVSHRIKLWDGIYERLEK